MIAMTMVVMVKMSMRMIMCAYITAKMPRDSEPLGPLKLSVAPGISQDQLKPIDHRHRYSSKAMAGSVRLTTVPAVIVDWRSKPIPLPDAVEKNGRLFQLFDRQAEVTRQLVFSTDVRHNTKTFQGSKVWDLLVKNRQEAKEQALIAIASRDSQETLGFNAEGKPLTEKGLQQQQRRFKRSKTVSTKLQMPDIVNVDMPGFADVPAYTVPMLAEPDRALWIEMSESVLANLHKAFEHELQASASSASSGVHPKSKAARRREKALEPGVWYEPGRKKYVVPWHRPSDGSFHRKYVNTMDEVVDFQARIAAGDFPLSQQSQGEDSEADDPNPEKGDAR